MSNVKNPQIEFVADYDWISGHFDMEKDRWVTPDDMRGMLADFSSPSFGLRLTYTRSPQFDRATEYGGRMTTYLARIEGAEAVRWSWFDRLYELLCDIQKTGKVQIQNFEVTDTDAPEHFDYVGNY